jgi:mono/diheme cytochrome c family protein
MTTPRLLVLGALLLLGCDNALPVMNLERMKHPAHFVPYEGSTFFEDGRAMRPPPLHTVPYGTTRAGSESAAVFDTHGYRETIPVPLSSALLATGERSFRAYCSPCHGELGDGNAPVARNMELRKPPTLVDAAARALPPGRLYQVIVDGYGLMPAYGQELSDEERWATVAYLAALQLSAGVTVRELPAAQRAIAERALAGETP